MRDKNANFHIGTRVSVKRRIPLILIKVKKRKQSTNAMERQVVHKHEEKTLPQLRHQVVQEANNPIKSLT